MKPNYIEDFILRKLSVDCWEDSGFIESINSLGKEESINSLLGVVVNLVINASIGKEVEMERE